MRMNDQRGLTIFEVLLSISIGSIALMILMSILTVTLLSKNESEYVNNLSEEIYQINHRLRHSFNDEIGYGSVHEFETESDEEFIFIFVDEFDYTFDEETGIIKPDPDYDKTIFVLWLDVSDDAERNGLFYFEYKGTEIDYASLEEQRSETHRLGSKRLVFSPESEIVLTRCLRYHSESVKDAVDPYSTCANAYIELNFHVGLRLRSGEVTDFRQKFSTLFY